MSWHYLRELEGESLQDICSDGEPCVPLKSRTTHAEFYCNGKLMDSYLDSLSGMTSAHSMEDHGEAKSKSSAVDSHVLISVQQEKAQALMEKTQDSGEKWHGSFVKYSPDTCSWKTHQCSLLGDLEEFSETWPAWGLMRNGECWERQKLVQSTSEIESGLWGTPTTSQDFKPVRKLTPSEANGTHGVILVGSIGKEHPHLIGRYLKPLVTEYLMGWPIGWTDLKPLEMDKSHCVQPQHGEYSSERNAR